MAVGSTVDVVMPQMGVSVSEGTVSRWLKSVGDRVEADETIVEISTDKVDTEVPSPASGVVTEILVQEGETVPVETRLAVIQTGDGPAPAAEAPEPPPAEPAEASASAPAESPPQPAAQAAEPAVYANGGGVGDDSMRTVMSPVVARMVGEHGLDVSSIPGTGRGGRVTKRDVEAYLEQRGGAPAPARSEAPAAAAAPAQQPAAVPAAAPAAASKPAPAPQAPAVPSGPLEEVYKFSTIRKVIAKHMRESLDTHAHVTQIVEVDMTRVAGLRKQLKPQFEKTYGVGLSFLPFIMRAVVDGIARWPWMNADVRGDEALIRRYVNMGMAVAIDDGKGLLVPVIKNAEQLNLVGLSRAIVDLADRARKKALQPDEMSGATFTITNPGVFGTLVGTPIIPHGSVGIIDTGAIVKRPVVVSDVDGNDSIAIRSMMYLSISFDHRLVDGAYAAQFMQQVKKNLEGWGVEAYGA
jgi:pyruvate dehydrogenase E2 component (dihydrolipoamide acetyltransferase)